MHPILSSFVAAMLSIHALLGCCWHHAQGCEVCDSVKHEAVSPELALLTTCCQHAAEAGRHDLDRSGHDQHAGQEQPHRAPCKCQIECRGTCAYLLTPRALTGDQKSTLSDCVAMIVPAITTGQSALPLSWPLGNSPANSEPPVRLHLLHQILLI